MVGCTSGLILRQIMLIFEYLPSSNPGDCKKFFQWSNYYILACCVPAPPAPCVKMFCMPFVVTMLKVACWLSSVPPTWTTL